MASTRKINVRVPQLPDDPLYYRRAGFAFQRGVDNIVEVTPEQLEVLRADKRIAIGDPPSPPTPDPVKR